jgi:hypothetical protein
MTWLFLIIPLVEIVIFSLYRVKSKTHLLSEIIYHTIFQTIIAYLFLVLVFYQSFIFRFYPILIIGFALLFLALIYFLKDNDLSFTVSGVLKLEGIKNNILIVLVTVFPLYVFLTIFRFNNWYFQILFSLILVFIVLFLSILLRKTMENLYQNIKNYIMDSDLAKYIIIWSIFGFLLLFNILFQIPINPIKNQLNLSNNAPYFRFDGLPVDVDNSYKQELVFDLFLTDNDGRSINDYFLTEEYLYLVQKNKILKYDIDSQILVKKYYIIGDVNNNYFNEMFFVYEDYLYFYCAYGLFEVTEDDLVKIGDITSDNSRKIRLFSDEIAFLKNIGDQKYELLSLNNNEISIEDTIDLEFSEFEELVVISETLFYKNGNDYVLFENAEVRFDDVDAALVYYNSNYHIMYYLKDNVIYLNDGRDNLKIVEFIGKMLNEGEVVGDLTVLRDGTLLDETRLLIFNFDMSVISIYNHLDLDRFYKLNDFNVSYIVNYRDVNDRVQFMQVESNGEKTYFQIYNLENKVVDLKLPFYSHYGILSVIVILIAIIIPITDDIRYLTYLDFNSVTKED